jgi:hypothetical protein
MSGIIFVNVISNNGRETKTNRSKANTKTRTNKSSTNGNQPVVHERLILFLVPLLLFVVVAVVEIALFSLCRRYTIISA